MTLPLQNSNFTVSLALEWTARLPFREEQWRVLAPGFYYLLDLCTDYELTALFAQLSSSQKMIFKGIHEEYRRDHHYTGRV